ncbi:MAG: caspase family protein [Oceanospirillales bacterium]|nr:caspase family protein [Oceanospirillales bacterium]
MNIGIVIGVSDYQRVNSLPGCITDANSIKQLLDLSNKCEEILYLTENTNSKDVKSRLSAFVRKHEVNEIEEVIFYFSGHGLFDDDEFYYIFSDYAESKIKQTSLENSELDNLLRSLSAKLTVKIVDACQAGTRYVKDPDIFRKYLQRSEEGFDKCYFFYSSQNNQSSYQSEIISDFTQSFLNAFIERPNQDVRYKDVMDTLSDEFSLNAKQTPFFVMQGNYTESFGYIAPDVSEALIKITTAFTESEEKQTEDSHKTLVQLVKEEAELFCSKDDVVNSVITLSEIISSFSFKEEISDIFEINVNSEVESNYPIKIEHVGKSLNGNTHDYMVDIDKKQRTRRVPRNKFLGGLSVLLNDADMVDEYYMTPVGASSTVDLPYSHIAIRFQSKYPNVNDSGCIIIPFISQTKVIVFSAFYYYKTREWDVKTIDSLSIQWVSFEEFIKKKNEIRIATEALLEEFENFSVKPMKSRFELLEVVDDTCS